jgi:hypothetical protein
MISESSSTIFDNQPSKTSFGPNENVELNPSEDHGSNPSELLHVSSSNVVSDLFRPLTFKRPHDEQRSRLIEAPEEHEHLRAEPRLAMTIVNDSESIDNVLDALGRMALQEDVTENTHSNWDSVNSSLFDPQSANANNDTSDTATDYSVESTLARSGNDEYIHAFAQQLGLDLEPVFGLNKLSTVPPLYISEALRLFSWKLHEESRNPFQWEMSVALHRKRE